MAEPIDPRPYRVLYVSMATFIVSRIPGLPVALEACLAGTAFIWAVVYVAVLVWRLAASSRRRAAQRRQEVSASLALTVASVAALILGAASATAIVRVPFLSVAAVLSVAALFPAVAWLCRLIRQLAAASRRRAATDQPPLPDHSDLIDLARQQGWGPWLDPAPIADAQALLRQMEAERGKPQPAGGRLIREGLFTRPPAEPDLAQSCRSLARRVVALEHGQRLLWQQLEAVKQSLPPNP